MQKMLSTTTCILNVHENLDGCGFFSLAPVIDSRWTIKLVKCIVSVTEEMKSMLSACLLDVTEFSMYARKEMSFVFLNLHIIGCIK